jgi:hypothetical protein
MPAWLMPRRLDIRSASEGAPVGGRRSRFFQAAKVLMDCRGEDAAIPAARRADALSDAGDPYGATARLRFLEAIDELMRRRRDGEPLTWRPTIPRSHGTSWLRAPERRERHRLRPR